MAKKTGSIKNFNVYYNKLLDYAKLMSITIYFHKIEDQGTFFNRTIYLDKTLNEKQILAVLLHELGHFIDEMINPKRYISKRAVQAYTLLAKNKEMTQLQKQNILIIEKAACEYGKVLAKKLKIKTGSWYKKEMDELINTYKSIKTKSF